MMPLPYNARGCIKIIFYCLLNVFALCTSCLAADIRLNLGCRSVNDTVVVSVENRTSREVMIETVYVELNRNRYEQRPRQKILPHQKKEFKYTVTSPGLPGTYPLICAVRYMNDGKLLSMKHASVFNYQEAAPLDLSCTIESASISDNGDIILRSSQPSLWQLILPDEITLEGVTEFPDRKVFHVKSGISGLTRNYAIFAVAENIDDGTHRAAMVSGTLSAGLSRTKTAYSRGRVPSGVLFALAVLFLGAWFCLMGRYRSYFLLPPVQSSSRSKRRGRSDLPGEGSNRSLDPDRNAKGTGGQIMRAVAKYTCRMFFVTCCYFILKNVDSWLDFFQAHTGWETARYLLTVARDNLRGSNYEYFFRYFVDCYWGACLVLVLPYLYYYDSGTPLEKDKYACFMNTLSTLGNVFKGKGPFWNYTSRLGMLTLFVKIFYIPYLTSWVINNTFHQHNLIQSFHWDLATVNAFLVALFIYMDTAVFSFGYVFEAGVLKNKIKSVEPTLLGWVVCLWCYPPFNVFSFKPFDHQFINIAVEYPGWVEAFMTCLISALWGIFAWASISLGFKGSNLTNRGIVASGPYRFCRHPAYVAKATVWIIQGIFFAQYTSGILFGFLLIYFMRAWTEERHLSMDPDYLNYKKKVRWRFVPGVV